MKQGVKGEKFNLRHLSFVISKNSELEPQFQKYKGRVVLRGDIVKDDSESYAAASCQNMFSDCSGAAESGLAHWIDR